MRGSSTRKANDFDGEKRELAKLASFAILRFRPGAELVAPYRETCGEKKERRECQLRMANVMRRGGWTFRKTTDLERVESTKGEEAEEKRGEGNCRRRGKRRVFP